ncbi:MAG: amidohydrolase [Phocaeicola sp.]
MRKSTITLLLIMLPLMTMYSQSKPANNPAIEGVALVEKSIEDISQTLWNLSEVSHQESRSSKYLKGILVENGFSIVSDGASNVPTAFIAEYGSGSPVVGIMVEYDALPGLGNAPVARKEERSDGVTNGHGCGHNLIGAGAMGAALSIKQLLAETKIKGTLRVYGAAAEETEGAKVYMARDRSFNDVDAMLHWHPYDEAIVANGKTAALSTMYIEFRGKSAHAGNSPWLGRSALDAAELFTHGVNMMREHVEPTARIQYIITNGGKAPNVVPDFASVLLVYRDASRSKVEQSVEWLKDMAKGAALMTQCQTLAVDYFGLYDLLANEALAIRMQSYLELVGVPHYTADELDFAKEVQKAMGVNPIGMAERALPMPKNLYVGGSSDVGDVSWITPTMGLTMPSMPRGIGLHTWGATACHGMSIGTKAAIGAAKVLAATAYDLFADPQLLKDVQAEFASKTAGFTYKSPINAMIKEPIALPDSMRRFGTIIDLKEEYIKNEEITPVK